MGVAPVLREFQADGLKAIESDVETHGRVLAVLPTGGGKTVVAAEYMRRIVGRGCTVAFVVHRFELAHQTVAKLADVGIDAPFLGGGGVDFVEPQAMVCMIQTLVRRVDRYPAPDYLIIDEAHHTEASTYQQVLDAWPETKVLGLTATPWRADGKGLADTFRAHVVMATPLTLREKGFLCPADVYVMPEADQIRVEGKVSRTGDYTEAQLAKAGETAMDGARGGNVLREYRLLETILGRPPRGVVFAASVEHSKAECAVLTQSGVTAEHVDGTTDPTTRAAIFARVRSGETSMLTNCAIATEGLDIPELEACFLRRPVGSLSLALQMMGRVLRPSAGKSKAFIYDFADVHKKHGGPYKSRVWAPLNTVVRTMSAAEEPREAAGAGGGAEAAKTGNQSLVLVEEEAAGPWWGREFTDARHATNYYRKVVTSRAMDRAGAVGWKRAFDEAVKYADRYLQRKKGAMLPGDVRSSVLNQVLVARPEGVQP